MLDTVTVVTSWVGDDLKGYLDRVQKVSGGTGEIVWDSSQTRHVEGSWSSKIGVKDVPANVAAECGLERYGRLWLCEGHRGRMKGGGDLEARLESGIAPVSKCRERVWVPRWRGHYDRCVSVHGSVAKYIQGHNVTGRWEGVDIEELLWMFHWWWGVHWHDRFEEGLVQGIERDDLMMCPGWGRSRLLIDVSRADIALTFRVGKSRREARDWMRGLQYATRSREGLWMADDDTGADNGFSLGRKDTERTWKVYLKDVEIEKRGRHVLFDEREDLRDLAVDFLRGTVRIELTLRRSYLRGVGVPVVGDDLSVMMGHWDKLAKGENMRVNGALPEGFEKLSLGARGAYLLWERGEDVRPPVHKVATYYKYRGLIKDAVGVDIGIRRSAAEVAGGQELEYGRGFLESCHVGHEEFPAELTAEVQGA